MTKKQLTAIVTELGGMYSEDGYANNSSWRDMRALAPKGMTWKDGEHEIVGGVFNGTREWADKARDDVAERVRVGVEPCRYGADCEWCLGYDGVREEYADAR